MFAFQIQNVQYCYCAFVTRTVPTGIQHFKRIFIEKLYLLLLIPLVCTSFKWLKPDKKKLSHVYGART